MEKGGQLFSSRLAIGAQCVLFLALVGCQTITQEPCDVEMEKVRTAFFEELKLRGVVEPSDLPFFSMVEGGKIGFVRGDFYKRVGDGHHIRPESFVAFWDGEDCVFDLLGGLPLYLYWAKDASGHFKGAEKLISRGIVKPLLRYDNGELASMEVFEKGKQVMVVKDTGKHAQKYQGYQTYDFRSRRVELTWTNGGLTSVSQLLPEMYSEKIEKSVRRGNNRLSEEEKFYPRNDLFVSLRYLGEFQVRNKHEWEEIILELLADDWFRLPAVFSFDSCKWENNSKARETILKLTPMEQFEGGEGIDFVSVHWVDGAFSKLEYRLKAHPH